MKVNENPNQRAFFKSKILRYCYVYDFDCFVIFDEAFDWINLDWFLLAKFG